MLQINLVGTFLMTREAIPTMRNGSDPAVVNLGSTSAAFAHPYMSAYAASKGGVQAMTHTLALEFAKERFRFNWVQPGSISSGMTAGTGESKQSIGSGLPADADYSLFGKIMPTLPVDGGDMELVGVYAYGEDKGASTPRGRRAGPNPPGVKATGDIADLIARNPDACCCNPSWPDIEELVQLLEVGVNVCSSAAWITGGKRHPRLRRACGRPEKGQFHRVRQRCSSSMTNMLGMVLSGSCDRFDEIRITESVNCSTYEIGGNADGDGFLAGSRDSPVWPRACAAKARCSQIPPR